MKSGLIIFFMLFMIIFPSNCQELKDFESNLEILRTKYITVFRTSETVDKLKDEFSYIKRDAYNLVNEFEEFIETGDYKSYEKVLVLKNEINNLYNLVQNNSCECLSCFNTFINANSKLVKEQDGVRIYFTQLGNFKLFYAYSLNNCLYNVVVRTTNKLDTTTKHQFGLYGEIEIFSIFSASQNCYITNLSVNKLSDNGNSIHSCKKEFPRQ